MFKLVLGLVQGTTAVSSAAPGKPQHQRRFQELEHPVQGPDAVSGSHCNVPS